MAVGTQQFHMALSQYAFLLQLHGKVQTGLSADARKDCIRSFVADDLSNVFQCQGFHIDLIGDAGIGHNGGGIGIA